MDPDVGGDPANLRHSREELLAAQSRYDSASLTWLRGHRDRAAQREDLYAGRFGMRDGHSRVPFRRAAQGDVRGESA
jgi:hypothetical protein